MLDKLQIFQGETTSTSGHAYARLPVASLDVASSWELAGALAGPHSRYATTLPATIPFRTMPADDETGDLLAHIAVPDPCTWSLDIPSTYLASIQLLRDGKVVAQSQSLFGFRRIGVVGRHFAHDGKRWVLRGAKPDSPSSIVDALDAYRESRLVCIVDNPADSICEEASKLGAMLMADLTSLEDVSTIRQELTRLAAWPSVFACLVSADVAAINRSGISNLLIGTTSSQAAADFLFCKAGDSSENNDQPIVVYDAGTSGNSEAVSDMRSASDLRAACDALQKELAPQDMAGYVGRFLK